MLSATLYQQSNDLSHAAAYAEQAQEIAVQTDDYNWQARIAGFLASQYRWLKVYPKSKAYADKAMAAAQKISNPELAANTMGLMYQEKAYGALDQKTYQEAITFARNAQKQFSPNTRNIDFLTAHNEQLIGDAYIGLKSYDSSLTHYKKAMKYLEKQPENYIGGLVMNGLANTYMKQGKMKEAKFYLDSAQAIADRSHYQQLKVEVYETVKAYASAVKDIEELDQAQKIQDTARTIITQQKNIFVNQALEGLEQRYAKEVKQGSDKTILIIAAIIILAATFIYIIFMRRSQKAKFNTILARFKEREEKRVKVAEQDLPEEVPHPEESLPALEAAEQKEVDAFTIPEETRQKLLRSLEEFEAGTLFTNRSISLSFLAGHINTNTKYLSKIINLHKQKDFSGYINELRVNYIIKQLQDDPVWRKYKISTLADEAGFSSHSKFAAVFKSITGLSPSLFIEYIEEAARTGRL